MFRNVKNHGNFNVWLSGLARMKPANHEIEEMVGMRNNRPFSIEGNECPLQLHQQIISKHQAIDVMIDPHALHCLNERQEADPVADGSPPIVAESPQDANAIDNEMSHDNNI